MGPPAGGGHGASRPSSPARMQQTVQSKQAAALEDIKITKDNEADMHLEETDNEPSRNINDLKWHAHGATRWVEATAHLAEVHLCKHHRCAIKDHTLVGTQSS